MLTSWGALDLVQSLILDDNKSASKQIATPKRKSKDEPNPPGNVPHQNVLPRSYHSIFFGILYMCINCSDTSKYGLYAVQVSSYVSPLCVYDAGYLTCLQYAAQNISVAGPLDTACVIIFAVLPTGMRNVNIYCEP